MTENYEVGDRLKAADINALISWANRGKNVRGFLSDNTEIAQYKSQARPALHLVNNTGEAIKPFSVFSIINESSSSSSASSIAGNKGIPRGTADIFNVLPNPSPFLFLTNGPLEVPERAEFEPEFISFNKPTRVRASANDIPNVGESCGVSFGEMRVGTHTNGLVCLTPSWEENSEVYVWVCRSREPIKVVGCVTSKITKAIKVGDTVIAGSGQIQVVYRNASFQLNSVNRPAFPTSRWNLKVYNYASVEYAEGMLCAATDTLGMGLTVDYDQANQLCRGSSSSSSSQSSSSRSSSSASSLSSFSSSSSLSSFLSSSSRSSASYLPDTCCPEIGSSYTNFPPTIIGTITRFCCAAVEGQSFSMTAGPHGTGVIRYTEVPGTKPRCVPPGTTAINFGVQLACEINHAFCPGGNCWVVSGFSGSVKANIITCIPLHIVAFNVAVTTGAIPIWCNGFADFEFTE